MESFILHIRQPPHIDTGIVFEHLRPGIVEKYEHNIARLGGFWTAKWEMPLGVTNTADYLRNFFSSYLGCGVQERTRAGITWEGIIWSMELTLHGLTRRLDRNLIWNAVRCLATDRDGNHHDTAASAAIAIDARGYHVNQASVNRYDRREFVFTLPEAEIAEAEAAVQKELSMTAFPEAKPIDVDPKAESGLLVEAVGRVYFLNDYYVSVNSSVGDETLNISQYISEILAADTNTAVIAPSVIATNTTQTKRIAVDNTPVRVWDKLEELTEIGDTGGNPYSLQVEVGGRVRYELADRNPRYHWTEQGPTDLMGGPVSWEMTPSVVRDMTGMHINGAPSSSFIQDGRDMWPDEVTMTDSAEFPKLTIAESFSPYELLHNFRKHMEYLEREARRQD